MGEKGRELFNPYKRAALQGAGGSAQSEKQPLPTVSERAVDARLLATGVKRVNSEQVKTTFAFLKGGERAQGS